VLSLPLPVRIFLCTKNADMRKSFDGLAALASGSLALDPLCLVIRSFFGTSRGRANFTERRVQTNCLELFLTPKI
jgi:hypothetical protein